MRTAVLGKASEWLRTNRLLCLVMITEGGKWITRFASAKYDAITIALLIALLPAGYISSS